MPALKRDWTPHPAQQQIMTDGSRFRVVAAGRRFGKTKMSRGISIERGFAEPGAYIWYVAPSHGDAYELGFEAMLESIPDALVADKMRSVPPSITLTNGTKYSFRSADGKLRGRGLDMIVVDEGGEIPNRAWKEDLRPSLSDTGGDAIFIGTPKGRNWFFESFQRGNDDTFPEWASFQFSTYDNPHIPDSEVEAARAELPERVFKQEYLAIFLEDEGAVFGNVDERNTRPYAIDDVTGQPPYSIGVDLARADNYTVAVAIDQDGLVVDFGRWRGGSWARMGRKLAAFFRDNTPATARMDATRDNKIIEDLQAQVPEVTIEPVSFNAGNKADLIENLAARLETGDVVYSADLTTVTAELTAFEYDTTKAGNISYGAPDGYNDDCVDAFALAARQTKPSRMGW